MNPRWKGKLQQIVSQTSIVHRHNHGLAFMPQLLSHGGCLQLSTQLCLVLGTERNLGCLHHELRSTKGSRDTANIFYQAAWKQFILQVLLFDFSSVPATLKYHSLALFLTSITAKTRDSANPCSKPKSREIPLIPRLLFGPTAITVKSG